MYTLRNFLLAQQARAQAEIEAERFRRIFESKIDILDLCLRNIHSPEEEREKASAEVEKARKLYVSKVDFLKTCLNEANRLADKLIVEELDALSKMTEEEKLEKTKGFMFKVKPTKFEVGTKTSKQLFEEAADRALAAERDLFLSCNQDDEED